MMAQRLEPKKVICDRCGKMVPVNQVKYVPVGDDYVKMICRECTTGKKEEKPKEIVKDLKKFYNCSRCKYDFKYFPGRGVLRCPYCGKSDKLIEKKPISAEQIIKISDSL